MNKTVDISEKSRKDEIISLNNMVRNLCFRLSGYVWSAEKNSMVYSGKPLATTDIINSASSLLQSFSENSNLITSKSKLVFYRQRWEISSEFNRFVVKHIGDNTDNYGIIMKSFRSTLQNMGDIILESKDIMKNYLTGVPDDPEGQTQW